MSSTLVFVVCPLGCRSAAINKMPLWNNAMTAIITLALLASNPDSGAAAAREPEQITITDGGDYSRDNSITSWTIDATGSGFFAGDRCRQCRAQQPYYERFQISPDIYKKVLETLDPKILSQAQSRPCTLPTAQADGQATFGVSIKKVSDFLISTDSYSFFENCQSDEIAVVKQQIAAAKAILSAAVAQP